MNIIYFVCIITCIDHCSMTLRDSFSLSFSHFCCAISSIWRPWHVHMQKGTMAFFSSSCCLPPHKKRAWQKLQAGAHSTNPYQPSVIQVVLLWCWAVMSQAADEKPSDRLSSTCCLIEQWQEKHRKAIAEDNCCMVGCCRPIVCIICTCLQTRVPGSFS